MDNFILKVRAWDNGKMIYPDAQSDFTYLSSVEILKRYEYEMVMFFTGLYDINGKEIYTGDRLRFYPCPATPASNDGCIWDGTVTFEDGVFTVNILDVKQVKNPDNWDRRHDWINSRRWSITVGYPEYGTWNCPRKPLTQIQCGFGSTSEHYTKYLEPLSKKYGYGKRIINAEIIGNARLN